MQGLLYAPPVQGICTTETRRYPATRLHGRGCRAGTRPKLTNPEQEGKLRNGFARNLACRLVYLDDLGHVE